MPLWILGSISCRRENVYFSYMGFWCVGENNLDTEVTNIYSELTNLSITCDSTGPVGHLFITRLNVLILLRSTILIFYFGNVPTVWYILFFILLKQFRAQFDLQSISWLNIQMYWCNIWRSYHCWMILILTQLEFRHILCVRVLVNDALKCEKNTVEFPNPNHNGSGRFGAVKSDSTHHFFGNAWTKLGPLRFSQFSGCWLILSVYWLMSFAFSFGRLLGVR
jgi:hypothetical protein